MEDWLRELVDAKAAAIEGHEQAVQVPIQTEHDRLIAVLKETNLESLLLALVREVVSGHPAFPKARLHRSVVLLRKMQGQGYSLLAASQPWSGWLWEAPSVPLWSGSAQPISEALVRREGDLWKEVEWRLELETTGSKEGQVHQGILVCLTANALSINNAVVQPAGAENVKRALVKAFKNPITWRVPVLDETILCE